MNSEEHSLVTLWVVAFLLMEATRRPINTKGDEAIKTARESKTEIYRVLFQEWIGKIHGSEDFQRNYYPVTSKKRYTISIDRFPRGKPNFLLRPVRACDMLMDSRKNIVR